MKIKGLYLSLAFMFVFSVVNADSPIIISQDRDLLYIPSVGVLDPINPSPLPVRGETYSTADLDTEVMRLQYMAWKDTSRGRTVLIGHGGGVFQNLHSINYGDHVWIIFSDYPILEFEVYDKYWVLPSDESILTTPTNTYELVLITCSSDESHRLIVKARYIP